MSKDQSNMESLGWTFEKISATLFSANYKDKEIHREATEAIPAVEAVEGTEETEPVEAKPAVPAQDAIEHVKLEISVGAHSMDELIHKVKLINKKYDIK